MGQSGMKNVQVEGNTRAKVQRDVEGCAALSRDLVRLRPKIREAGS